MRYNAKYDRWVSKDGLIYRYDNKNDRLIPCETSFSSGYERFKSGDRKRVYVHRAVYETFVDNIPTNKQIDHIDTIKSNNKLSNLRWVTRKENMNNPLTKKHISETKKGHIVTEDTKNKISKSHKGMVNSEFGRKYLDYYGYGKSENPSQYDSERYYYRHYGKCRWEVEDKCKL